MTNEVLKLDDLKASNLPELQGFKQKQEELVKECPFVEITDNATYEMAKKHRTALLKGRTALESQDKLIASKLSNFRKDVKTIIDDLVAITSPHETKQQEEVKRFEEIKENERLERERIEKLRIKTIKDKIESIETECLEVIQKMTFQNIIIDSDKIAKIFASDFDFEEYEILLNEVEKRLEVALQNKINDLTEKEKTRVENEKLKNEIFDTRILRLEELGLHMQIDSEKEESAFFNDFQIQFFTSDEVFNATSDEFEKMISDLKTEKEAKEKSEREEKELEQKKQQFEIRKNRMFEIGFCTCDEIGKLASLDYVFQHELLFAGISAKSIFECDVMEFEKILTDAKTQIKNAEIEAEKAELKRLEEKKQALITQKKNDAENKARVKRLAPDKKVLEKSIGIVKDSFISEIVFREFGNEETENFRKATQDKMDAFFDELLTELENL